MQNFFCLSLRRFAAVLAVAIGVALTGGAQANEFRRAEMARAVEQWQAPIRERFLVHYGVKQKLVADREPAASLHVGDSVMEESSSNTWGSIHAWDRPRKQFYHFTSSELIDETAPVHQGILSDGKLLYRVRGSDRAVVHASRKLNTDYSLKVRTPQEDLYRQLLGMESIRQGWGVTLKGNHWQYSFEVTDAIRSSEYQISAKTVEGEKRVIVENPGVDHIELLPNKNFAIASRTCYWKPPRSGIRTQYDVTEFEKLNPRTWVPRTVVVRYYDRAEGTKAIFESNLTTQTASLTPPEEFFQLQTARVRTFFDEDRGMTVRMEPLKGRSVRELLDAASPRDRYAGRSTFLWLVVLLNIALVLIVVYLWRRRRSAIR